MTIPRIVLEYLGDRFKNDVSELLDDPSYIIPDEPDDWSVERWIGMYVLTAEMLGFNFWKMIEESEYESERRRLLSMLKSHGIEPGWRPKES